jgi:hypothetical protein
VKVLAAACAAVVWPVRPARAFGEEGAFHPRPLLTGQAKFEGVRSTAPARWAWELTSRTSAPARLTPVPVRADDDALLGEPFVYWSGEGAVAPLTGVEIAHLRRFFGEGGVMLVDDSAPETGVFGRDARREIARVLPDSAPISLGADNVLFKTFYLLRRPVGRVEGPAKLEGIVRGGNTQVIFSDHDLGGALAQSASGIASIPVTPHGEEQRERAVRLAVNVAMYVLCSNYKDDQVHAPHLMLRRAREQP